MTKHRKHAASCNVGNILWVTGGQDARGTNLKSTEFFDPSSGTVEPGPDLPVATFAHCICMIESISTAIIMGGFNNTGKIWFYNFESPEQGWVPGPDLNQRRAGHVAGVIKDSEDENKTFVITAGGNYDGRGLKSTEILEVGSSADSEMKWIKGPDLPFRICTASSVVTPDDKSFLSVGGWNSDEQKTEDSIYKLQCHNLKWEWKKMDQKLKVARYAHIAAFVPDSVLDSL